MSLLSWTVDLVGWARNQGARVEAALTATLDRELHRAVESSLRDKLRRAQELSQPRTRSRGRTGSDSLQSGWRVTWEAIGASAVLENVDPLFEFKVNPTRPHVILPRNASVLRFETRDGAIVFARRVNHPGSPGRPDLVRALTSENAVLEQSVERAGEAVARALVANFQ